jgi:CheY-like chemotaxis protein
MNKYKLLLIDDDKISLIINKQFLKMQDAHDGSDIKFFDQPEEGFEEVRSYLLNQYIVPLWIILDINMPNMDGWEVLDQLMEINTNHTAKVIMMTSSINEDDKIKAKSYPFVCDFLSKPMDVGKAKRIFDQIEANL